MDRIFDLSKVKGTPSFMTNIGKIRNYTTPLATREFEAEHQKVEVVEYIDNSTFGVVLDNSMAVIQSVDLEGNRFTKSINFTYFEFGANIRCDDIEVFRPTNKGYVLCWDIEEDQQLPPGDIYLIEFDLDSPSNKRVLNVSQKDGFSAKFRLRLGLWNLPQGGVDETYIIIYDQGMSSTQVFGNKWIRVFDRIRLGSANYVGVVDLTAAFPSARSLYDIFYFNSQLLITTSIKGEETISMTSCSFYVANFSVYCNEDIKKTSNVSMGYIGLTNNRRWVQYNILTNNFITCDVGESFAKPDWISRNCEVISDMPQIPECFIRIVEDNWHAKVAVWVRPNGEYAGVSIHSRDLGKSWVEENTNGVLINNYLYVAEPNQLLIRRLATESLSITAKDLGKHETTVTVLASDDETKGESAVALIYLMDNAGDRVMFDEDHRLPEVDLYGGYDFLMPLTEDDYQGNNLSFSLKMDDSIQNYTKTKVYNSFPIEIIFTFRDTGLPDFVELSFTKNFAVGQDIQNRIFFFTCGSVEIDQVRCQEQQAFTAAPEQRLQKYSHEMINYVLAWTNEPGRVTVYIWDSTSNSVYSKIISAASKADDVHSVTAKGKTWILVSFSDASEVKVFTWTPTNPSNFNQESSITKASSNMPYFCPTDIYDTYNPIKDGGYIEILSVCYHTEKLDQRVFRFTVGSLIMVGAHPITLDLVHPQICAVGDSYIIASINQGIVVGKSQQFDENTFHFNLDFFADYHNLLGMNCVHRTGMATIYFEDKSHRLGYFNIWADTLRRANKRIQSTVTGIEAGAVNLDSFSFGDSILHVLYDNEGAARYFKTLSKAPLLRVTVENLSNQIDTITGNMTLTLKNEASGTATIKNKVTIRKLLTDLKVEKNITQAEVKDNFQLEDHITIKGHVFNASLKGSINSVQSSSSPSGSQDDKNPPHLKLIQRANLVQEYIPQELTQALFQHIEAHGNITVALHMDKSYASFFTIFNQVSTYKGVVQPRDGVQSFDFGLVSGDRILIAYANAPVSGNKLKLMLLNNDATLVAEGSAPGRSYEKIRVVGVDSKDNTLIFALDLETQSLDMFYCTVGESSMSVVLLRTIHGVIDFDVTAPKEFINLYYLLDEAVAISHISWMRTDVKGKSISKGDIEFQRLAGDTKYWLRSVSCETDNDIQSSCVINTLGTVIFQFTIDYSGDITKKTYVLQKFGNFDGKNLYMDTNYIAMRAVSSTVPRQYAFLIWKRMDIGGDGLTYCGIEIEGDAPVGTDIYSFFTPFTMIKNSNESHLLYAGTHNPKRPLQFYKIGRFALNNSATKAQLSKVYLEINGVGGSISEVGTLDQFSVDEKYLKWWVPTLVVIGLLVAASAVYLTCIHKSHSEDENENEEGEYHKAIDGDHQMLVKGDQKQDA